MIMKMIVAKDLHFNLSFIQSLVGALYASLSVPEVKSPVYEDWGLLKDRVDKSPVILP
jgi:hypothetical protein